MKRRRPSSRALPSSLPRRSHRRGLRGLHGTTEHHQRNANRFVQEALRNAQEGRCGWALMDVGAALAHANEVSYRAGQRVAEAVEPVNLRCLVDQGRAMSRK